MPDPLEIPFSDGTFLRFTHKPGGWVSLEARGALSPTVTAIEIAPEEVERVRAWFGKHDAAKRAEMAEATQSYRTDELPAPLAKAILDDLPNLRPTPRSKTKNGDGTLRAAAVNHDG